MAKVRGHKLKLGKVKDGQSNATCSCGGWKASGTVAVVTEKWNKNHVNKFGNLR